MIKEDDRNEQQKTTHRWGVVARDRFMSGWGGANGGSSRCAWAVDSTSGTERMERVERWVRARSEMRHVRVVDLNAYRAPRGTAHFHIYVVGSENHPSLR